MVRAQRYRVEFVHTQTGARRRFTVWAFNKLDASVAGMKLLAAEAGDSWRRTWWEVGTTRE